MAVALVFALAAPAAGEAAEAVSLAGTPMEVQLWPGGEAGYTLFIVTAHIPEDAELPVTVRIPIPAGSRVLWSGEILGGPVAEDPERAASVYAVERGQVLEMTAETTRTVQYEAVGPALQVVDGLTTAVFDWVQSVEAGEVSFSVRLPASAEVVRLDPDAPGAPRVNERGEQLYTLRPVTLSEGQEYRVTAAYGPEGAGGGGQGGRPPVLGYLLAALGVAMVALVLVWSAQRGRAR